ncbi:hypothetical protein BGZ47_008217 [Haplosporangium gracile]|nr:hypothetical protein BGZ47_008217 [Haplosporangium gracile]
MHAFTGHAGLVGYIAYSPCGQYIASGGEDCSMRLRDMATGQCLAMIHAFVAEVVSITWVAPRLLYTVGADNVAYVWRVAPGEDSEVEVQLNWRWEDEGFCVSSTKVDSSTGSSPSARTLFQLRGAFLE